MYDELYHHGIKGQKWGVRRYQKLNGTLTPAGKARLKELQEIHDSYSYNTSSGVTNVKQVKINSTKNKNAFLANEGIRVNDDGSDTISKNTEMVRYANSGETLGKRRKYVSISKYDKLYYANNYEKLEADLDKPISEYIFTANKDLKVANNKEVTEYIIEKYGNKKIKDLYETFYKDVNENYGPEIPRERLEKIGVKLDEDDVKLLDRSEKGYKYVSDFLENRMHRKVDDISEHYIQKGYDAIFDVEDGGDGFMDYPVVLLNPDKNVRLLKETQVWEGYDSFDDDWD